MTDAEIKAFAAQHAPELAKNITRLCGQVIAKGIQGHLEHACELQQQVIALEEERDALKADRDHWKANHDNRVEAARMLIDRDDLPLERVKAYQRHVELQAERDRLRTDAERLDWLCTQYVTVRTPLRYGSRENFMGSPDDNDGESVPWDIRTAIDKARVA